MCEHKGIIVQALRKMLHFKALGKKDPLKNVSSHFNVKAIKETKYIYFNMSPYRLWHLHFPLLKMVF